MTKFRVHVKDAKDKTVTGEHYFVVVTSVTLVEKNFTIKVFRVWETEIGSET